LGRDLVNLGNGDTSSDVGPKVIIGIKHTPLRAVFEVWDLLEASILTMTRI